MNEFLKQFNIIPKNNKLYETALSHSSFVNEHNLKSDYERLEFLGDAVLELVVSDYLYQNYQETEGEMTKVRASYVCENALYEYMKDLDLIKYIKVGNGELGNIKKAIVADIFESIMAAIYLEEGFLKVKEVILAIIVPYIKNPNINAINIVPTASKNKNSPNLPRPKMVNLFDSKYVFCIIVCIFCNLL